MRKHLLPMMLMLLCAATARAAEPADTLERINRAVENSDTAAFTELVDLDGILEKTLNIFLGELKNPAVSDRMPPLLALMFSQAAQSENGENLRALLRSEAKSFVLNGISTGAFAGREARLGAGQGMLAPLFAGASTGRKRVVAHGEAARSGEDWLLPFTVRDDGAESDYTVTGRFSAGSNGALRLVGIENLPTLMAKIGAENTP